jgi:hypothetical protein
MDSWRAPLDEFTLRYLMSRLIEDRENHLNSAQDKEQYAEAAGEAYMVRAEECARIIEQIKKIIGMHSDPPPKKKRVVKHWPEV